MSKTREHTSMESSSFHSFAKHTQQTALFENKNRVQPSSSHSHEPAGNSLKLRLNHFYSEETRQELKTISSVSSVNIETSEFKMFRTSGKRIPVAPFIGSYHALGGPYFALKRNEELTNDGLQVERYFSVQSLQNCYDSHGSEQVAHTTVKAHLALAPNTTELNGRGTKYQKKHSTLIVDKDGNEVDPLYTQSVIIHDNRLSPHVRDAQNLTDRIKRASENKQTSLYFRTYIYDPDNNRVIITDHCLLCNKELEQLKKIIATHQEKIDKNNKNNKNNLIRSKQDKMTTKSLCDEVSRSQSLATFLYAIQKFSDNTNSHRAFLNKVVNPSNNRTQINLARNTSSPSNQPSQPTSTGSNTSASSNNSTGSSTSTFRNNNFSSNNNAGRNNSTSNSTRASNNTSASNNNSTGSNTSSGVNSNSTTFSGQSSTSSTRFNQANETANSNAHAQRSKTTSSSYAELNIILSKINHYNRPNTGTATVNLDSGERERIKAIANETTERVSQQIKQCAIETMQISTEEKETLKAAKKHYKDAESNLLSHLAGTTTSQEVKDQIKLDHDIAKSLQNQCIEEALKYRK